MSYSTLGGLTAAQADDEVDCPDASGAVTKADTVAGINLHASANYQNP